MAGAKVINILSVLVGGGIGCANLLVWRVIVAALTTGRKVSGVRLTGLFLLKLGLLGGLVALAFRSGLTPLGVVGGFGGVLFGACLVGLLGGVKGA